MNTGALREDVAAHVQELGRRTLLTPEEAALVAHAARSLQDATVTDDGLRCQLLALRQVQAVLRERERGVSDAVAADVGAATGMGGVPPRVGNAQAHATCLGVLLTVAVVGGLAVWSGLAVKVVNLDSPARAGVGTGILTLAAVLFVTTVWVVAMLYQNAREAAERVDTRRMALTATGRALADNLPDGTAVLGMLLPSSDSEHSGTLSEGGLSKVIKVVGTTWNGSAGRSPTGGTDHAT